MPYPITVPRLGWSMEQGTFLGWKNDHRCRLDHRSRRNPLKCKHPSAAPRAPSDLYSMIRDRQDATVHRRIMHPQRI